MVLIDFHGLGFWDKSFHSKLDRTTELTPSCRDTKRHQEFWYDSRWLIYLVRISEYVTNTSTSFTFIVVSPQHFLWRNHFKPRSTSLLGDTDQSRGSSTRLRHLILPRLKRLQSYDVNAAMLKARWQSSRFLSKSWVGWWKSPQSDSPTFAFWENQHFRYSIILCITFAYWLFQIPTSKKWMKFIPPVVVLKRSGTGKSGWTSSERTPTGSLTPVALEAPSCC